MGSAESAPTTSVRRLALLCNPTAGGGRAARALDAVATLLRADDIEVRVARTASHEHAVALAEQAASGGEEVIAFGGDGMVRIAAHAARTHGATLGIIPGGRGNDFAATLDIPADPLKAAQIVRAGASRTIDVGEVGGQTFVGNATIGLESEVTSIANRAPRIGGQLVYLGATFIGLARWKPATYTLVLDGGPPQQFTGYMACAANSGRFGGGMRIAPDAHLDDGQLDVIVLEHVSKFRFMAETPKVFKGTHVHEPTVKVFRARQIELEADRPFDVYADGDRIAATPAVVRVVPGALRVLAP